MKRILGGLVVVLLIAGVASAQTWPDFHLTNGTHYTSYGVEDYDPLYPKNLYIDPVATLRAGSTELDNIYDGNQVYLNGGSVYASAIDANDFTWNSGNLYLDGGVHTTFYGFSNNYEKKTVNVHSGAVLETTEQFVFRSYGNSLRVTDGGTVNLSHIMAESSMAHVGGNEVVVSGSNSSLISGGYDTGYSARGNSITIINGGYASLAGIVLQGGAVLSPYSGHRIEVSGTDSRLDAGNITVGGNRSGLNSLVISNGATVNCSMTGIGYGRAANGNSATVSGSGTVWNNTGDLFIGVFSGGNSLEISDGAVVSNVNAQVSYQYDFQYGGNEVSVNGSGSTWINSGVIEIGTPANDNDLGNNRITIAAGGEVIAESGVTINQNRNFYGPNTLNLNDAGRLTVGTDFDASMNGFIYGSGSTLAVEGQLSGLPTLETGRRLETADVLGDMTVHGTYAPGNSPADSLMNGILTLATDGTLEMELGGLLLGDEYDRLTVTDAAYLDGTLDIVLLDEFSLAYGDSFDLFNWGGGVNGEFASITTSALTGDLEWDTSELYTTGIISVIPEPASISLIGLAAGGLYFTRRFFPAV